MRAKNEFLCKIKYLFSTIFQNTIINPIMQIVIHSISFLSIILMVLDFKKILKIEVEIIKTSTFHTIQLIILTVQVLFIGFILFIIVDSDKSQKRINNNVEQKTYIIKIIKKIISVCLVLFRKNLLIPVLIISLQQFNSQGQNRENSDFFTIIAVLNLTIYFGFIYSLSGIGFLNKIVSKSNILSYPYILNIQTLFFIYLPIFVLAKFYSINLVHYLNFCFVVISLLFMSFRPALTFRNNKINIFGNSLNINTISTFTLFNAFDIQIQNLSKLIFFLLICLIFTWILFQFQIDKMTRILLYQANKNIYSRGIEWSYEQNLFYHIVNFEQCRQQILLFILKQKQKLKLESTISQRTMEGSQKVIMPKQNVSLNSNHKIKFEFEMSLINFIDKLKTNNLKDNQIKKLFYYLIQLKFKIQYDPRKLSQQNLGKKQLYFKLFHSSEIFLMVSQILLLDQSSHRKCYYYLKTHQIIQNKSQLMSFLSQIYINSVISIIQQKLKLNCSTNKQYNLKAQLYLKFEKKYQDLKQQILKCNENSLKFWEESLQKQPNNQYLQKMIFKIYFLNRKIQNICFQIVHEFQNKSLLVIFQLISQYSFANLNKKIFSSLSQFHYLIKKFKDQLENQRKAGKDNNLNNQNKYYLHQDIGLCILDLQNQPGKIQRANQFFWSQFYGEDKRRKKIQQRAEPFIFDIIIPQLKDNHIMHLKNISESQRLNYKHTPAFFYQNDSKIIHKLKLQVQIIPSLMQGFKISIFLLKDSKKDQNSFTIMIRQDFRISCYTKQFQLQKQDFVEENREILVQCKQNQCQYLSQKLLKNKNFINLLESSKKGISQVQNTTITVENSEYKANLKKMYFISTSQQSESKQSISIENIELSQNSSLHKQSQKIMYWMQWKKIHGKQSQIQIIDSEVKETFIKLISTNFEQKSRAQSLGSFNIQKTLNQVCQEEKQYNTMAYLTEKKNKTTEIIQEMQKNYKYLNLQTLPISVKKWFCSVVFILTFLIASIALNIWTFNQRSLFYDDVQSSIKTYNGLMTDVAQISIGLRDYNYYAQLYGPQDPHIPLLINRVNREELQIGQKLRYLSPYLNQRWKAIEVAQNTKFKYLNQVSYIVIANYMLSSMTYISEVTPQDLQFPIFIGDYFGQSISTTQVNFLEAIYNGIYIVINSLKQKRQSFLYMILSGLTGIGSRVYIYPNICGLGILAIFCILSVFVQRKSEDIQFNAIRLLKKVSQKIKRQKMKRLIQFKENNCFIATKSIQVFQKLKNDGLTYIVNSVTSISEKRSNFQSSQLNKLTITFSNRQFDHQTKRDFVQKQQFQDMRSPQDYAKSSGEGIKEKFQKFSGNNKISFKLTKTERWKILFYLLVSLPFSIYFFVLLFGGINMDNDLSKIYQIASQVCIKKTNAQLAYLFTRQMFFIEKTLNLEEQNDWSNKTILLIQNMYKHNRKLQAMISNHPEIENLQQFVKIIQNGNICDHMDYFKESLFFDVKFNLEQCKSIDDGIFEQGFKSMWVWYLQTATSILDQFPDAFSIDKNERLYYLTKPQFKKMKTGLAYFEILIDTMNDALSKDIEQKIRSYKQFISIYSSFTLVSLILILAAINYRYKILARQRRMIRSIIGLVSIQQIKADPELTKSFREINLEFYK